MKQGRNQLGFLMQEVYRSGLLLNASRVEGGLQARYQDMLQLGTGRLWRRVAMGRSSDTDDEHNKSVYKVFVTYSTKVGEAIKGGQVIVQF